MKLKGIRKKQNREQIGKEDQERQLSGPFDPPVRLVLEPTAINKNKTNGKNIINPKSF